MLSLEVHIFIITITSQTIENASRNQLEIEPDVFVYLLDFLDPGVDCINFKMYDTTKRFYTIYTPF